MSDDEKEFLSELERRLKMEVDTSSKIYETLKNSFDCNNENTYAAVLEAVFAIQEEDAPIFLQAYSELEKKLPGPKSEYREAILIRATLELYQTTVQRIQGFPGGIVFDPVDCEDDDGNGEFN